MPEPGQVVTGLPSLHELSKVQEFTLGTHVKSELACNSENFLGFFIQLITRAGVVKTNLGNVSETI